MKQIMFLAWITIWLFYHLISKINTRRYCIDISLVKLVILYAFHILCFCSLLVLIGQAQGDWFDKAYTTSQVKIYNECKCSRYPALLCSTTTIYTSHIGPLLWDGQMSQGPSLTYAPSYQRGTHSQRVQICLKMKSFNQPRIDSSIHCLYQICFFLNTTQLTVQPKILLHAICNFLYINFQRYLSCCNEEDKN